MNEGAELLLRYAIRGLSYSRRPRGLYTIVIVFGTLPSLSLNHNIYLENEESCGED